MRQFGAVPDRRLTVGRQDKCCESVCWVALVAWGVTAVMMTG